MRQVDPEFSSMKNPSQYRFHGDTVYEADSATWLAGKAGGTGPSEQKWRAIVKPIEETDGYVLVQTSSNEARARRYVARIGNLTFGARVHRSVYQWTAECVDKLGLEDKRIAVIRGSFRFEGAPRGGIPDQNLGAAISEMMAGKSLIWNAVYYSPHLDRRETFSAELSGTGERKTINVVDYIILQALLRLRFPREEKQWIQDRTTEVFFFGWDSLPN